MFENEEPTKIIHLCESSWAEIVEDLTGKEVSSISIGSIAENFGLKAPRVLDSTSISNLLKLTSFDDFSSSPTIGTYSTSVTALVILNVWEDMKSWKAGGKPIDGASHWIFQRILLGIPGPQLQLREQIAPAQSTGQKETNFSICEANWPEIQADLSKSELQSLSIRELADHLGYYWPRKGSDLRLADFINRFDNPHGIFRIRSIGWKKAHTIIEVIIESWRFESRESDSLKSLLSSPEVGGNGVPNPIFLLKRNWGAFCAALRSSDFVTTTLEQHYRPLGIMCAPALRVITLEEIIGSAGLREFISTKKGLGKKKIDDLAMVLQRIWATVEPDGVAGPAPADAGDQAKLILGNFYESNIEEKIERTFEVARVSEITRKIIRERYGFYGQRPKTLETIGEVMGVTRERIRQLQAAGEKKVRDHSVANAMIRQIEAFERLEMIDHLRRMFRSDLLREKRLKSSHPSPGHRFLIEIEYGGSNSSFLDAMVDLESAQKLVLGWWVGEPLDPVILAKSSEIREFLKSRGLPFPIELVARRFGMTSKEAVNVVTAIGFRVQFGLVFETLSALHRRSIFAVLVGVLDEEFVWNETLFFERSIAYRRNRRLSFRLFERDISAIEGLIVNSTGPYAILNPICFEVFSKEIARETLGDIEESDFGSRSRLEDDSDLTSGGLFSCLWQIFEHERILRFEQVEERYLATGRESLGSVGPILINHADIIRYAPGWWGKRGLSLTPVDIDTLCNTQDLRLYIEAKRGGGLLEMFRFWMPEMEYQWARWAENEADPEVFQSLLSVIDPPSWPVPDPIKSQWSHKKEQIGFYRLPVSNPDFSNGITEFEALYGLIALAVDRGELGYAGVSHFLGWRFMNDRRAFSAIALLVILGILEPRDEVDRPHQVSHDADAVLRQFSESLMMNPREFEAILTEFVQAKLKSRAPDEEFGWFSAGEFRAASIRWIGDLGNMKARTP